MSEARTESETEPEPGDQPEPETLEWREWRVATLGEWRGDHQSWTQPSLKHIVTLIVIPTSKDTVC